MTFLYHDFQNAKIIITNMIKGRLYAINVVLSECVCFMKCYKIINV